MDPEELTAWLRLTLTEGVGNTTARRLLAAFGLIAPVQGALLVARVGRFVDVIADENHQVEVGCGDRDRLVDVDA